jgi:hypothetical protein
MNNTQENNTAVKNNNQQGVEFYKSKQNEKSNNTKTANSVLENHNVMKEQIVEFYKSRQNKKFEKPENTFSYK